MRYLSNWARQHVWQTRLIFIFLHTIIIYGAWFVGTYLYLEGIVFQERLIDVLAILCTAGLFLYPLMTRGQIYWRRKTADFSLAAVGSVALIVVFNQFTHETIHHPPVNEYAHTIVLKKNKKKAKIIHKLEQKTKRIQQRFIKRAERFKTKYPNTSTAEFIILFALLALIGTWAVASLSCNLACSGNQAAAIAVGVIGGILILGGLIWGIIWAVRRGKRLKAEAETSGE